MQPSKKADECRCGQLSRLAEDPKNSIVFDVQLNEYHILRQNGSGYTLIYFCPFCGGSGPKSQRGKASDKKAMLIQQTHEIQPTANPEPPETQPQIDSSKPYDIYCIKPNREIVVYRNATFKGATALLPHPAGRIHFPDYVELEQANGQSVFIPRSSIFQFCASGTRLTGEVVAPDKSDAC
jgi:hypothetical protein